MKPEDRKRLKQHIEMIVEHKPICDGAYLEGEISVGVNNPDYYNQPSNSDGESKAENVPGMFEIIGEYKCKNRLLGTNIRLTFVQFGKDLKFKKGYYLTCDSHGDFKNDNINKKDALFYMRKPWIWCDECAALHFNQEGYVDGDDDWVDTEKMMWEDKNGGF